MKRTLPLLALALPLLLAACSNAADSGPKRLRVAVVPKGTNQDFWKAVESGARRADRELDDLDIVWKGPQGEGDTAQQISIVESFVADQYDAICLAPLDARALEPTVNQAIERKIPVVIFDSALASSDVPIVSYVATNNVRGGEMAADHLAKLLDGKGRVVLMPYAIGSESTEQRERGFLQAIAKYPGITVISSDKHGGPDESRAIETGESLLATFGAEIDGIFCSNESSTSGMLTALTRDPRRLAGRVKLVGFDSSANIVKGMEAGGIHGVVLQDPVKMGYESVKAAHARLSGVPTPPRVETGETLATPENLAEPRIHALLFPELAK